MSSAAHLVAYLETLDASSGYTGIAALADTYCVANGTSSLIPRDAMLLAAYLGGAGLLRGRVQAPSLLRVAYPHLTPFQATIATATGLSRVTDFSRRPPRLVGGEGVSVAVENGGAVATLALLLLGFDMQPAPPGEAFLLRYMASGILASANVWSPFTTESGDVVWETSLPAGTYAILAMDHWGTTALAARAILQNSKTRPGVPARTSATAAWLDPLFTDGRLGILGYFTNWQMPGIDVLCSAADTAFEGRMLVVRIGGTDAMPSGR